MKRALVLGGGGAIGVAWESGLVTGLRGAGVDFAMFDAIVGTSAGAMVGAQIASGRLPPHPNTERPPPPPGELSVRQRAALAMSKMDPQAANRIFSLWGAMQVSNPAQIAEIGAIVRGLDRSHEPDLIAHIHGLVRVDDWPSQRLLVNVTDAESGERRVIDRDSDVPLPRAIAASAAVPGMFPPVEIQGRLYMDGQVHSSTNADVLVPHKPAQVLIAMPTNALTGRGIGRHAERMLEREVDALRAAGCKVLVQTPSSADAQRTGNNLMDVARAADAYEVGLETGRRWAEALS